MQPRWNIKYKKAGNPYAPYIQWKGILFLRYPKAKSDITGIKYEPWHYRYVGKEAAEEITEQGITLKEYLES